MFPSAPSEIEIELTLRLLSGNVQIRLTAGIAGAVGVQAALHGDAVLAWGLFSIAFVALARLISLRRLRLQHQAVALDMPTARRWVQSYAMGSYVTSLLVGATNLVALSYQDAPLALLVITNLCCYVFSMVVRTAVRPIVCLPSMAIALGLTLAGLPAFLDKGIRLDPLFAAAVLGSVGVVLILTSMQLASLLYRTTRGQIIAERELSKFAHSDPLTGIGNRLALREQFAATSPGPTRAMALLCLDLDGFKPINDRHGHHVGDAVLRLVARRLASGIRPGDSVFRIGGDEFAVLMWPVRQRSDASAMARRLMASISKPYAVDDKVLSLSASIGIAITHAADTDLDSLAATADAALYDAKRSGRGTFRFARDATALKLIA